MDVSTCIITYNQEQYIAQAIESALMQKVNFEYEIVICDDHSTDNTPAIIGQYAAKHPQQIKVYPAEKNTGMLRNWERALKQCMGRYIAILEGDDFWNDENKLQKQYAILQSHPDCAVSFTNAHIKYEGNSSGYPVYVTQKKEVLRTADLLAYNLIPTCSVLMRNNISSSFFHPAYFNSPFADWIIHILNSRFGKLHFLDEFTCTYRVHGGGIWGGLNDEKQLKNKLRAINCIDEILENNEFKPGIKANRKNVYQKLCAYYKQQGQLSTYLNYRLKLLLN